MSDVLRELYLFKKYPTLKEFIKFCLVGLTNLAVDILIYWFLTRVVGLYYLVAAVISFIVAVTWSFAINRRWTFRHEGNDTRTQYVKFFLANTVSMVINMSLLFIFVDYVHLNDILAKFIVAVVVAFINFTMNKFWTFKPQAITEPVA